MSCSVQEEAECISLPNDADGDSRFPLLSDDTNINSIPGLATAMNAMLSVNNAASEATNQTGDPTVKNSHKKIVFKLEKATEQKISGNEYFKQNEHKKALRQYQNGLMYVRGIEQDITTCGLIPPAVPISGFGAEAKTQLDDVTADLHNNIAACMLKQDPVKYERIIDHCKEVVRLRPENIKAYYRMGLAYHKLGLNDSAAQILRRADEMKCSKDTSIIKLLQTVEKARRVEEKSYDDIFRNTLVGRKF